MSLITDRPLFQPRRPAHRIEQPSQPWTTARCHRLLRPLTSRIASLRREASVAGQPAGLAKSTSGTTTISLSGKNGQHEETDAESGWMMPKKKRPRLTYSQRRSAKPPSHHLGPDQSHLSQGSEDEKSGLATGTKSGVTKAFKCMQPERRQRVTAPGEIVPSTPILRRARGKIIRSPIAPVHELELDSSQSEHNNERRTRASSSAQKRLEERLASLRTRFCTIYAELEGIYRSLEALLKATAASSIDENKNRKGPRSFLDMCLRQVPRYIAELEAWERMDAEQAGTISTLDDINTSAEVYNELESLGTNIGWKHLRVVVRADGLGVIRHAIEEGLFDDDFTRLLIDLCVQMGAAEEAEELVAVLVNRQYPRPISTESRFTQMLPLQPLPILNSFACQTQRTSFIFRQYEILLSSGKLPAEWLATSELESIWSSAVQALADCYTSYDAINFITHSILLLCSRKRTLHDNVDTNQSGQDMARAIQRTLMSAISILASMSLLGETWDTSPEFVDSNTRRRKHNNNRFQYTLRACINGLETRMRGRGSKRLESLYLALFLSSTQTQSGRVETQVKENVNRLSLPNSTSRGTKDTHSRNRYDSIAWITASIARACGRATSVASHQCLQGLFERLESLKLAPDLLDKLKAAAAFSVAQQTNSVKDLIYAESLHPHISVSPGGTSQRQSGSTLFTGYRWEETIGEWVTVSPIMNKRRAATMKTYFRSSDSAKGTETSVIRSDNPTSCATDDLPAAMETVASQVLGGRECDTDERIQPLRDEKSMMMKKRPRRLQSAETLPPRQVAEVPLHQSVAFSPAGEVDPDKENRVRLLAKKPRRSSGRIVLGARSLSRDSIGRRDAYSDDELCA
ncbi:hypothetical protein F5Y08DRAFT_181303 [Xylaria arbuscula]|nr:hypothetical protein F5Y08DRAFT_181303 [Xylaria arbuscula]